jgi:integrase
MKQISSKTSATYWSDRVYFHNTGKGSEKTFSVKMQFDGRRERFPLDTANREIAARTAAEIYRVLKTNGWNGAISVYKKDPTKGPVTKTSELTVGQYLAEVREKWTGKQTTLDLYIRGLRKIVSDIDGLDPRNKRFDYIGDGAVVWHQRIDQVPLASITDVKVEKWKFDFLAEAEKTEIARNKRKITINTYLRNAKSLFNEKVIKGTGLELPSPRPLADIDFFGGVDQKYYSVFDIRKLLVSAKDLLADLDPDAYSVILLAAFGGLRRHEIDLLEWPAIDFKHGVIQLRLTDYFTPKTQDALRAIPLREKWVMDWFKDRKRQQAGDSGFVVAPKAPYFKDQKLDYYRCADLFRRVSRWLRTNGVKDGRPLHVLRKEAGSDIVKRAGLISGAAFLRHKTPTVTAMHYSDYRVTETPSYGDIQQPEELTNIVKFP